MFLIAYCRVTICSLEGYCIASTKMCTAASFILPTCISSDIWLCWYCRSW